MKSLALLRHAKSSWDDPTLEDFERPLNGRGRKAANAIGAEMRRLGLIFDLVLASPAQRVVETIVHAEYGYKASLQPQFEPLIYEATPNSLLEVLGAVDDEVCRLLLIGHNPGLQGLARILSRSGVPLYDAVTEHCPTAALLLLELDATTWRELGPGTGTITEFIKPRDLEGAAS